MKQAVLADDHVVIDKDLRTYSAPRTDGGSLADNAEGINSHAIHTRGRGDLCHRRNGGSMRRCREQQLKRAGKSGVRRGMNDARTRRDIGVCLAYDKHTGGIVRRGCAVF